jgi:hypothetical protein
MEDGRPDIQEILPLAQELAEKLSKIDPNLVLNLTSRKNSPEDLRSAGPGAVPSTFTEDFRNFVNMPNTFTSSFTKTGNGFINIHTIAQ